MSKTGAKTKGYFKRVDTGSILTFQFNPSTITTKRGVSYSEMQGCGSAYPTYQYTGGEGETISFNLDIIGDATKSQEAIRYLEGLMPPKSVTANFQVPPIFYFAFGNSFTEQCVLNGLSKSHEEFDQDLGTTSVTFSIELKVIK